MGSIATLSANTTEQEKILETAIDHLRSSFNHVSNIYDQLRIKALTVMAGEVAIVTFMFSGDGIARPKNIDELILYAVGIILLIVAFALLLWTISPLEWKIPYDNLSTKELKERFSTKEEFLVYLNDDYVLVCNHCFPLVGKRAKRFTWTIYALAAGVIILLLIKYGGYAL